MRYAGALRRRPRSSDEGRGAGGAAASRAAQRCVHAQRCRRGARLEPGVLL